MQLIKTAVAGTMESGDIMVTIEPRTAAASRWSSAAASCSSSAGRSRR